MNKQELLSAVQSLLSMNRDTINYSHQVIAGLRAAKKEFDEENVLELEYMAHNILNKEKTQQKLQVRNQRALKFILREIHNSDDF
jgi:hypothetical protein